MIEDYTNVDFSVDGVTAERREGAARMLRSVWLYDRDKDARAVVDGDAASVPYRSPIARQESNWHMWGKDYAAVDKDVPEHLRQEPLGLCQFEIGCMPQEQRTTWQEKLEALQARGAGRHEYYGLYAGMKRQGVLDEYSAALRRRQLAEMEMQQNAQLEDELDGVLRGGKGDMSLELMQNLKDRGMLQTVERASKALRKLGHGDAAAGANPVYEVEDLDAALGYIGDDEGAMALVQEYEARRGRDDARDGGTGFWAQAAEAVTKSVAGAVDAVKTGTLEYQLKSGQLDAELAAQGEEAVTRFLDDGGLDMLANMDEDAANKYLEEVRNAPRRRMEEAAKREAIRQTLYAAREQGRKMADEAGESGVASGLRRMTGSGMGAILPWLGGGGLKAAATLGIASDALGAKAAMAEEKGFEDYAEVYKASMAQAVGETVGMTLGAGIVKGGLSIIPGVGVAMGRMTPGIARTVAAGGVKGAALNWGLATATTAADFAVIIPSATAAVTGLTNTMLEVDSELASAWQDYKAAMGELTDAKHLGSIALQSMILAGVHAPARREGLVQNWKVGYKLQGGREEVYEQALREHRGDAKAVQKVLTDTLKADFDTDPVAVFNRAADAARVEVNKEQARQAQEDAAMKAMLARAGVVTERLTDGRVRIYTEALAEGGKVEKGERYSDVDADVAEKYLGRVAHGALVAHAEALRDAFAGKVSVDAFKKLYGKAARVEWLPKAQTLEDMKADAERARAKVEEMSAGDEAMRERALGMIVPEISPELTLRALIDLPEHFGDRRATEEQRGGQGRTTSAYVVSQRMSDGEMRYVLRRTDRANFFALSEELGEQALLQYQRQQLAGGDERDVAFMDENLGRDLLDLREWMQGQEKYAEVAGRFFGISSALEGKLRDREPLSVDEQRQLSHGVVEAFSALFRSGMVSDAMTGKGSMPEWMRGVMSACASASGNAPELVLLGDALRAMNEQALVSPEAGKRYERTVGELWKNHRGLMERLFEPYKEPNVEDYLKMMDEREREQAELDARLGRGRSVAPLDTEARIEQAHAEAEEEQARRDEREAEEQEAEEEALGELKELPGNEGKSEDELHRERVERYADAREDEAASNPAGVEDADGIFSGGRYVQVVSDGFSDVKAGMVPVERIMLSKDAPQFKRGADPESGVVHELKGLYRPDHDPIRVWQREDGSLEVISGRHRLAYARKAGATRIMCYVYKENERRNAAWARTFDMEQNIRDNQASELEVALYVRGENAHGRPLEDAELAEAGIDRKGTRGERGVLLGRFADESIIDALRNVHTFTVDDAVRVVEFARGDRDVQREGLRVMLGDVDEQGQYSTPGSITEARRVMQRFLEVKRAQEDAGWEQGGLGLGFGESLMDTEFNRFFGKYQTRRLKELAADRGYLRQIVGKKLSAKQAEKYGVDVNDPDGLRKRKEELDALAERWKNPSLHNDLMEEMRAAFKQEYAGESWLDMQRVDNAPLMVQSRELGRADFNIEHPLNSEPFDVEKYSERYLTSVESVYGTEAPTPEMVTDLWRQVVDAVVDRNIPVDYAQHLPVSPTPAVLRMLGVPERMMAVNNTVLLNKDTAPDYNNSVHQSHYVTREQFYELPEKMSAPLAVLVPKKKLKKGQLALCILTDMIEKRPNGAESNVIAAIHVEANAFTNGIKINKIASVYGKESIVDWELVYEKEQPLESTERLASTLQLLRRSPALVGADGRIYNEADLVNYKKETGANFSLGGERAATFGEMQEMGFTYFDPADGKRKFAMDTRDVRLSTGFTMGDVNVPAGGHKDVSLGALLHYPELYRAYPELKGMRVRLYRDELSAVGGFYAPNGVVPGEGQYIAVNVGRGGKDKTGRLLNVLLHESQHAVQHHEGWARGAGDMGKEEAIAYVERAIAAREEQGAESEWAKFNLAYLKTKLKMLNTLKAGDELEREIASVYVASHGEQEARYAGEGKAVRGENPWEGEVMRGVSGVAESWMTVPVPAEVTELGGITFGNAGAYAGIMQSRLAPVGDFYTDRKLFQIRDAAVRFARLLAGVDYGERGGDQSARLLLEAQGVAERAVSLLPNEYRVGLEPYRVWLSVFAKLGGSGDEQAAAAMVPMKGWDKRMYHAFRHQLEEMMMGMVRADEAEFWMGDAKLEGTLRKMKERWGVHFEEAAARLGDKAKKRDVAKATSEEYWKDGEVMDMAQEIFRAMGKVKTEKVLAKLLERVRMQLDAFRKDKALGKMRRAIQLAYPAPGKAGKPVKGRMDADSYRKVEDYMRLLELTEGQRALFERTRYTGESSEKAWESLEPGDVVTVDTYDEGGKKMVISCTKQEFETYACFERMSAAQAEAAGRALGEFISTGRQAWENAQETQRRRVAAWCAPLMEGYAYSLNSEREKKKAVERKALPIKKKLLNLGGFMMNAVQAWDVISGVPELKEVGEYAARRIAAADVKKEAWEKERVGWLWEAVRESGGVKTEKEVREFIDHMNTSEDSGVVLKEREPDFLGQETEVVRLQFLGMLQRKMRQKNFNANTFAEALRYIIGKGDEVVPRKVAQEAMDKYGEIGDADKSYHKAEDALRSLLTERELERFVDLNATTKKRAAKARDKWLEDKDDKRKKAEERGLSVSLGADGETLRLTRGEAAYRVLLAEQEDLRPQLELQGYDAQTVQGLRDFAGEKVMRLAYALREKLGERTQDLRELYEKVYGVPFPEVDNYFRAFFEVGKERDTRDIGEGGSKTAAGEKVKIMYTRHRHNASIDPTMSVVQAFMTASKSQDILLAYRELPMELQQVLNFREGKVSMAGAMGDVLGNGAVSNLREHVENMLMEAPRNETAGRDAARGLNAVSSAAAKSILNWRVASNLKQLTALFNTLAGSDKVGVWEWHKSAGRVMSGLGAISMQEMAERMELSTRFKGWDYSARMEALNAKADVKAAHGATSKMAGSGMSFMERMDVWANVRSAVVMYDAVYRKAQKEQPTLTKAELDELAMGEVRLALALKSQPLDWRQRSLLATRRTAFSVGMLFLGGESWNLAGNMIRLAQRGKKGDLWRFAGVWVMHGAALQALTLLYNYLTDDKEQWERRNAWQYGLGALAGPLAAMPGFSWVMGTLANATGNSTLQWLAPQQSIVPGADVGRAVSDVRKAFFGKKPASWEDKTIAVEGLLRATTTFALAAAHSPTTPGGARGKAVAYGGAGVLNLVDFILRGWRAVEERWWE